MNVSKEIKKDVEMTITDQQPFQQYKLDILLSVSSFQNQNGIRLNDYYRYSRFCGKKINKLRKLLKITQGKRKYGKIMIDNEVAQKAKDSRVVLILLLDCERKWAQGMNAKKKMTDIGKDIKLLKYNIKRKFKKSVLMSKNLFEICKLTCDTQTLLEAEAYLYSMEANYYIFTRKFEQALDLLKKSWKILENVARVKDTIESISYKEKINQLKTNIRLCQYNLNQDVVFDENFDINTVNDPELATKFSEILIKKENSQKTVSTNAMEVKYQGTSIPIKNEKLRYNFNKIDELSKKVNEEPELNKKMNIYTDIYNIIDEISKIIKKDKAEESTQASTENIQKIYMKLLSYVQNLKIKKYLEKTIMHITDCSKEFNDSLVLNEIIEKDNVKLKVKPQEMIKLYDNLIEYQGQLILLEKDNPDQTYIVELKFKDKAYLIYKIYYVGIFYLINKKFEDVYTIMHYILDRLNDANEFYNSYSLKNVSSLNPLNKELVNLSNFSRFIISKCFCKMNTFTEKNTNLDVDMNKKDKAKHKAHPWLYDSITNPKDNLTEENFNLFSDYLKIGFQDYKESNCKHNFNNHNNIIQVPPNLTMINPKPIVYDLTFQNIQYPNLDHKMKKEQKGLFSRAVGYFFKK